MSLSLSFTLSGRFPKYGGHKAVRIERTVFGYKNAENVDDGSQGKRSDSPRCFKFAEQRFRPSTGIWLPFLPLSLSLSLCLHRATTFSSLSSGEEESDNSGIMELWWNLLKSSKGNKKDEKNTWKMFCNNFSRCHRIFIFRGSDLVTKYRYTGWFVKLDEGFDQSSNKLS